MARLKASAARSGSAAAGAGLGYQQVTRDAHGRWSYSGGRKKPEPKGGREGVHYSAAAAHRAHITRLKRKHDESTDEHEKARLREKIGHHERALGGQHEPPPKKEPKGDGGSKGGGSAAHRAHVTRLQRKLDGETDPAKRAELEAKIKRHQEAAGGHGGDHKGGNTPAAKKPAEGGGKAEKQPHEPKPEAKHVNDMTHEEFGAHVHKITKGRVKFTDTQGLMHVSHRTSIAKELEGLSHDFPVKGVTVSVLSLEAKAYAIATPMMRYIKLNSNVFSKSRNELAQVLHDGNWLRWHDQMNDPAHIIAHEYGHVVDGVMGDLEKSGMMEGSQVTRMISSGSFMDHIEQHYRREVETGYDRSLSGYSSTNRAEWFAEAFAASVRGFGDSTAKNAPGVAGFTKNLNAWWEAYRGNSSKALT